MTFSIYWPGTNIVKSRDNAFTAHLRDATEIEWSKDRVMNGHNAKIAKATRQAAAKRSPKARVRA